MFKKYQEKLENNKQMIEEYRERVRQHELEHPEPKYEEPIREVKGIKVDSLCLAGALKEYQGVVDYNIDFSYSHDTIIIYHNSRISRSEIMEIAEDYINNHDMEKDIYIKTIPVNIAD